MNVSRYALAGTIAGALFLVVASYILLTTFERNDNWDNNPNNEKNNDALSIISIDKRHLEQLYSSDTGLSIAFVRPVFTAAAYFSNEEKAFYSFYKKYGNRASEGSVITTDLHLLNATITDDIIMHTGINILKLRDDFRKILPNSKIFIINDIDIHSATIFHENGTNKFDLMVLGHQEYVTEKEYENFRRFVTNGGALLFLDGNSFFAKVVYDPVTRNITFVSGHGWSFNGTHAITGPLEHFAENNTEFIGSNFLCTACNSYSNDPFGYIPHEDNYVTNKKVKIIHDYGSKNFPDRQVATYQHEVGKGVVIVLGIYSERLVDNERFINFLSYLIVREILGQE